MIIGIVGKSCSGKNKVAEILTETFDFKAIDGDLVGHQILDKEAKTVIKALQLPHPPQSAKIDRRHLAKIVFSDSEKLKTLEEILFPQIKKTIAQKIQKKDANYSINAVKLFESDLYQLCDAVIWVSASKRIRQKRAQKRDRITKAEIRSRFRSQNKLSAQPWQKKTDIYKVKNNGSYHTLYKQVCKVIADMNERRSS